MILVIPNVLGERFTNWIFFIIPFLTRVLKYGMTSHLNFKLSLVIANLKLMSNFFCWANHKHTYPYDFNIINKYSHNTSIYNVYKIWHVISVIYGYIYVCMHECVCMYIYICMYVCIYMKMYVSMHICENLGLCIYIYACMGIYVCMCMHVYVYVCVYVLVYICVFLVHPNFLFNVFITIECFLCSAVNVYFVVFCCPLPMISNLIW